MRQRPRPLPLGVPLDPAEALRLMDALQTESCCPLWALSPKTLCAECRRRRNTWLTLSVSAGPDSRKPLCKRCGGRHYPAAGGCPAREAVA